jgi:hypothetical protein
MKQLNAKSIRFKMYSNQTAGAGLQPVPHTTELIQINL